MLKLFIASVNFLATMSSNLVIFLWDSTRAEFRSESAKLEVTLTPHDLGVGICVSMCDMCEGSHVHSGREVSWNGSMCTIFLVDAEPAAALAWDADPFGALNSHFSFKMVHDVVPEEVQIVSGPFL